MESLHLAYALLGALSVVLAFIASSIRRYPISEPLLALVLGVIVGPEVLAGLDVPDHQRTTLLLEGSRLLLAISLMAVALRYPARKLRPLIKPVTVLVTAGMIGMAAITTGLGVAILGLSLPMAALLGACLTPTDPVLAGSVVTGGPAEETLPERTRQLLSTESGVNDGLAYPLVIVALAVVLGHGLPMEVGRAAYAVGVAVVIGVVLGIAAAKAIDAAVERHDSTSGAVLVFTLVLAVAALGIAKVAQTDGVLAVFVAGLAYNAAAQRGERRQEENLDEALNRYLLLPLFFLFGVELPWSQWSALGWAAIAFPVAVLLLRRLPVLLALGKLLSLRGRDAVFLGWFGPIGVSALFYLTHSEHAGVSEPTLWAAGSLVVAASTIVHGITGAPGRTLYRRVAEAR